MLTAACNKPYMPEIDWDSYNSVEDVSTYFKHFSSDAMTHLGDTLKVHGWLVKMTLDEWNMLTSNRDMQFTNNASEWFSFPYVEIDYQTIIERPDDMSSQVFVTGIVAYEDEPRHFELKYAIIKNL